jgi:serine/threonine-protein kinase
LASSPPLIAKYHIVRRLGHGGMGAVYLGRDPDLDRPVAIKVLREPMADEELLQRFLREARATANLRHENLITIYEVGSHDQQPFIAMEYVDGTTLGELVKRRQPLPLVQKLSYIEQICAGLHHAHRVGIVHRDIKPANIMVDGQGVIRILDFGIARVANSGMTSDGALIGTLNYMSPEQMLGRPVDFRSDIFSLGAVAYELLSYQQAFPGTLDDGLLQRLPQMPPAALASVCPGLPQELEAIILRALAKAPLDRFNDLDEMRTAVRHVRANVDPRLEVETIIIPSREKPKPPASSAERRGLLERRARQIAVHREAARAALARGDLGSAAAACDEALTLDPDDAEALTLRERVRGAATAAGFELPDTLNVGVTQVPTQAPQPPRTISTEPARGSRVPLYAAAAVVVLAIGGGIVWLMSGDQTPAAPSIQTSTTSTNTPAPVTPAPSSPVVAQPAPTSTSSAPVPQAPAPVVRAPAPSPTPAATPAPATVDALAAPLARVTQLHQSGDVAGALAELTRLGSSSDPRVSALARTVAQSAFRTMESSLTAATGQRAEDLAPASYTAAEGVQRVADSLFSRSEFVLSGTRALEASEAYRKAGTEARAAAAAAAAKTPEPSRPAPPPTSASAPAAASPSPATTAPPRTSALDVERPEILQTLTAYQSAYRQKNVEAIRKVYGNLRREAAQDLERNFDNCSTADLTFGNIDIALSDPPITATATVQSTYLCQPKTRQKGVPYQVEDVFGLRKVAGKWLIDRLTLNDTRRLR